MFISFKELKNITHIMILTEFFLVKFGKNFVRVKNKKKQNISWLYLDNSINLTYCIAMYFTMFKDNQKANCVTYSVSVNAISINV